MNINIIQQLTTFDSILDNIKQQYYNQITCVYIPDKDIKEIDLLHNYNYDMSGNENRKKLYLEAKNINKKLFE